MSIADRENILHIRDNLISTIQADPDEFSADKIHIELVNLVWSLARDANRIADSLEAIAINTQGRP